MAGTFNPYRTNPISPTEMRKRRRRLLTQQALAAQHGLGTGTIDSTPLGQSASTGGVGAPIVFSTPTPNSVTDFVRSAAARVAQNQTVGGTAGTGAQRYASGSPATGGAGALPTDPMSGFAGQYAPIGLDILYSNPEILARDSLKGMGYNPNAGLMTLAEDQARNLQYLAMLGMGTGAEQSITPENYLNFVNDYYKNQMTPGGPSPDVWAMVDSILNSPEGSALQAYLTDGTPQDQAEAFNTLVNVATSTLPPVFRKAIMSKLEDQTSDWLSGQAKGDKKASIIADFMRPGGLLK